MSPGEIPSRRRAARIHLTLNYANSALVAASGLLLVPLYLRSFGLETYGAWVASGSVLGMVGILDFGFNLVFAQRLAVRAGSGDRGGFVTAAGGGLVITLVSAALIAAVCLAMSSWIPQLVNSPREQYGPLRAAFRLAAIGAAAGVVQYGLAAVAQAWQLTAPIGVSFLAATAAGVAATLAGLSGGHGVAALGMGALARGLTGALVLGVSVARTWRRQGWPRPRMVAAETAALARSTAPVFFARGARTVVGRFQPAVVAALLGPAPAAVLSITGQIYDLCLTLLAHLGSASFSGLAHLSGEAAPGQVREVVRELLLVTTLAVALLAGPAAALNGGFIGLWVGPGVFGGALLSALLAVAMVVQSQVHQLMLVLSALGELEKTAWYSLGELAARVALIAALLPALGIAGMPLAALLTATPLGAQFLAQLFRRLGVERRAGRSGGLAAALPPALTLLALLAVARVLPPPSGWLSLAAQGALAAVVAAAGILVSSRFARERLRQLLTAPSRSPDRAAA